MDFLSRLFSFSGNKKRTLKPDESNSGQIRSKAESSSNDRYLESGSFCRESRIDQIEPPYSSIITANSDDDKQQSEDFTVSSTLLTRTLDRWNPETCVRLLRMPSVQNYSGLCKLISESDRNWMTEFLDMGGLEVLFESVDRLSSKSSYSSKLERTLLLLQCVKCLKAVVNSHIALEYIIHQRTYVKKIAEVLTSHNPLVKKQLFDFMSTLCVFSEDGHYLTLDVFESHRVSLKLRYRFAVLIIEIKQAEVMPYVGAVLGLINCIILGACGFRFRTRIRNEFLALGLQDLLESLKQIPEEEVQLQCSVFVKSQLADEEYARSMGIRSSFSHFALFQALLDKIEDTPLSASFLILLQNLNQLDPVDSKTDYVWSILEEITERAVSGAGLLRNWMLSEYRRSSLKTTATQTSFFMLPSISIEHSESYRNISTCDEDFEKESIKSFSSRDSGVPVSRNQSFASNGPRSHQNTLLKQNAFDAQFSDPVTSCSYAEFSNTTKMLLGSDLSDTEKENTPKNQNGEKESQSPANSFGKAAEFSFALMGSPRSQTRTDLQKEISRETVMETTPLSLRSDSPIPQHDTPVEEGGKTKKTFTFPFFSRSKKYSLPNNTPKVKVNPPLLDAHLSKGTASPAMSRSGMTSMDVKRSRKQTQISNTVLCSDNISLLSVDKDFSETAFKFEIPEKNSDIQRLPISKSCSITEEGKILDPEDRLRNLSKSTSDLSQMIPPPPPPPPLPGSFHVVPRPKSQHSLGLPANKSLRSSWSGNPTEFEGTDDRLCNTLPRPKSKMKTLNWAKIPSAHVSVNSIWSEIDQESKTVELNFEEMEKLFCQDERVQKESKTHLKKRTTSEVTLLDSKRSLSIGVFLKQFKGGLEEIVEHVRECRHKEIGAERLRTLLNLLPDSNEVKLLSSYSGDMNRLGTAEKFIVKLTAIDHYECRIEGMLLLEEFPTTIEILHDSVQSLLDACQDLLTNEGFKNFLKLILVTGNFINSGSYAGNAVGFRLSTLPKLMETRANNPRITLLHYLVEEIQRKDPDGIKFTNELLSKLNRCSRLTLESLSAEITQLDKAMQRLNAQIKMENGRLQKYFSGFTENGIKHLTILKNKLDEIKSIAVQLANRFCEDEKKFQLEDCLNIVSVFCAKIKIANTENQSRKKAEERKQIQIGNKTESNYRNAKVSTL